MDDEGTGHLRTDTVDVGTRQAIYEFIASRAHAASVLLRSAPALHDQA
jgi:hypothetical protein